MSWNFNEKLEDIIRRYNFQARAISDSKMIHNFILDLLNRRCANKKTAIWGVGKKNAVNSHCAVIINKYILNLPKLEYLIDSDVNFQGDVFLGYSIIAPEEIIDKNIEIVIIATKGSADSIKDNLKKVAPNCEYIDIYGELKEAGFVVDYNFFSEHNVYTELYRLKNNYENTTDKEERKAILYELIAQYLKIRDFHYAFYFADIYINQEFDDSNNVSNMIDEIKDLLNNLKNITSKRKDDIVIHLIDSLRAIDVYKTDHEGNIKLNMFEGYQEKAAIFTHAYSTGPATYESMIGTIKQKLSFQENVYENNNFMFDIDEFDLLSTICEKKYPISFYVAKDYLIMRPSNKIKSVEHLHMCEKLWAVLCDMADSKVPTFNFLYYPWELHFPMLSGFMRKPPIIKQFSDVGMERMDDFILGQYEDCQNYIRNVFQFYKKFFSDDMLTVFFADHSQPVYDETKSVPFYMYYKEPDRVSHVTFFISSNKVKAGVYNNLISMLDFNKIMKEVVESNRIVIPNREVAQYQYYYVQNKKLRDLAKEKGYMDYIEGISCFCTKTKIYVVTGTGKKEVYRLDNLEDNIITTREGKEFAEYIDNNYDTSFPDFWQKAKEV